MKKILYVHTAKEGFGIIQKAKKIEQGFLDAGCNLTVISFVGYKNKFKRIGQIFAFNYHFIKKILRYDYGIIFIRFGL